MNIVIATPYMIYPTVPHGGGQDLMALIGFLAERHAVRVVAFADQAQADHATELAPHVAALRLVRPAVTASEKWASVVEAARRGQWLELGRRARLEMEGTLHEWASAGQADVLLCAWTEMGRYLRAAPPGTMRVLDEVDVRFLVELAEAGARPLARWRAQRRRAEELAYCRAAHLVVTRSRRDLEALQAAVPGLRGRVLPPIAHTAALLAEPSPPLGQPGRVLFIGALDRARNQQAARWLAEAIWPAVRAAHPTAQLRLVGANPPASIERLGTQPGVEVTGYVPDLLREYRQARVVVAPMRSEAGALNKVIDALAAGRPVVATAAANAGVGAPPEAVTLANDAPGLARAIAHLLADDEAATRQGIAARRFAKEAFDWPGAAAALEATLLELANTQRVRSPSRYTGSTARERV